MSFRIPVDTENWLPVLLVSSVDGVTPVVGLTYSDVIVKYFKEGLVAETKALTSSDFSEGGDGMYRVKFSASECDTVGLFQYWVMAPGCDTSYQAGYVTYLPTGEGAISWTYTITDTDSSLPIPDVEVWITNDIGGEFIVAGPQRSKPDGSTLWHLDPGSYYIWRQKAGYNFNNPDLEVVA